MRLCTCTHACTYVHLEVYVNRNLLTHLSRQTTGVLRWQRLLAAQRFGSAVGLCCEALLLLQMVSLQLLDRFFLLNAQELLLLPQPFVVGLQLLLELLLLLLLLLQQTG